MATTTAGRILNCDPSSGTGDDWGLEHAQAAGLVTREPRVPRSRDLRAAWWNVGNQGTTGSCVGWAVADGLLRWHFVRHRRLPQDERLSVRFAWMAAKETDEWKSSPTTFIEQEGTSIKAALSVARKFGAVRNDVIPFSSGRLYRGDPKTFLALASRLKISSYFGLHTPSSSWRHWIAAGGPIVARFRVDRAFTGARRTTAHLTAYDDTPDNGGHAVTIVGYTPTHFIVRNSWGRGWGQGGFAYVTDDYADAAVDEAYGVTL